MFETYLKRSGSVPLEVQIRDPSLNLLETLVPHTSRLSSLTVVMYDSVGLRRLARHLGNPIPTLTEFSIVGGGYGLTIPSDIRNGHFLHVKKLRLAQVPSLRAPCAFPHVTELVWIGGSYTFGSASNLRDTFLGLPALERVEIVFQEFHTPITHAQLVTLPNVQRMSLHCSEGELPGFLEFLKLPNLTSLVVSGLRRPTQPFVVLPTIPFGENLPNFAQLSEMEVTMFRGQQRISFRSPAQATLDYYLGPRLLRQVHRGHSSKHWGGLPVDSIRKLVVEMDTWTTDRDDGWAFSLLCELSSLEHLEFRSRCGHTPRYLRQMMEVAAYFPEMKTLAVYFRSEREARHVYRLEDIVDGLGSGISVTWTKDSEIPNDEQREPESGRASWNYHSDYRVGGSKC